MNIKAVGILLILWVTVVVQLCDAGSGTETGDRQEDSIRLYLPRAVTIKDAVASIGRVGIIRGSESLAAKVSEIPLGRISAPNQEIVIDKTMLLGRLACSGIPTSKVTFAGAEKTTVKRQQQVIKGAKLVETASLFLEKNLPYPSVCEWAPIRTPRDFVVVGAAEDITLRPVLIKKDHSMVTIALVTDQDGRETAAGQVTFRIKHKCRAAVTTTEIPAGTVLTCDNAEVTEIVSDEPTAVDWQAPYGLAARRDLPARCVIGPSMVKPVKHEKPAKAQKPPIIVERNQNVLVRISQPGFFAGAVGKATQKGRAGDYIKVKVQITDTPRIIYARVNQDGTVEPVF